MTSEWDGTPWGGTVVQASNVVRMLPAKAAVGWQGIWNSVSVPSSTNARGPLKRMREEQSFYWTHPWIRTAERAVTRRVSGLPWHLEGNSNDEVDDASDPVLKAVRALLEKPQAALPIEERQVGIDSWTNLVSVTSRHLGICGMTHWYLDGLDGEGTPNALLYVNPARLYPVTTTSGHLIDWSLDPKDDEGRGGTLLGRENVLTFYLEPPDSGAIATGFVNAAWMKARLSTSLDSHLSYTLETGGRMSGVISPKEGWISEEQYKTLAQELRASGEGDPRERRLSIIRGPVEYDQTSATPEQIQATDLAKMTRDDIFTIWGVPQSQAPVAMAAGLNSGGTKDKDEAVLMQGAVHDRVRIIRETVQFGLLDRWNAQGADPQLTIEEPSFDDRTPQFDLAAKAKDQPLTRNERRDLLGLDPLPEYGPDGTPLGLAIDLPTQIQTIGQGEESDTPGPAPRFGSAPLTAGPVARVLPLPQLPSGMPDAMPAKALTVRASVIGRFEPAIRRAVSQFLAGQRDEIAARVRETGAHIARKPNEFSSWWDGPKWDKRLADVLHQGIAGLTGAAATRLTASLQGRKADPFTDSVTEAVLQRVGLRVVDINVTTRDAIASAVAEGVADGRSPAEVADLIEGLPAFNEARAELVARTETALAYNDAAISSYREFGVEQVQAIDGDEDDECRTRDGQVYPIEEADGISDHPNGTLDWLPVLAGAT